MILHLWELSFNAGWNKAAAERFQEAQTPLTSCTSFHIVGRRQDYPGIWLTEINRKRKALSFEFQTLPQK